MVLGMLGNLASQLFSTIDGQVIFGTQFLIELIMLVMVFWFLDIIFHFGKGV